jgi:transposase
MENKSIEEVARLLRSERNKRVFQRLQIVYWRMSGLTIEAAAKQSGLGLTTVKRITKAYKESGYEGVRSHYEGSHYRKLSFAEEERILNGLVSRSKQGEFVRIKEMKAAFEVEAGVTYHKNAFYLLLKRHGWRKLMPRGAHPKAADEAACEAAKKLTK